MAENELVGLVGDVLKRTPAWLRKELSSPDDMMRERAEAALAAMVAAAVSSTIGAADAPTSGVSMPSGGLH